MNGLEKFETGALAFFAANLLKCFLGFLGSVVPVPQASPTQTPPPTCHCMRPGGASPTVCVWCAMRVRSLCWRPLGDH